MAGGLTRRGLLGGALACAALPAGVAATLRPTPTVLIVVERGLPAADLVRGCAPAAVERSIRSDGWGGARRAVVAAPPVAGFAGPLSELMPRTARRGDLALRTDLRARDDVAGDAMGALGLDQSDLARTPGLAVLEGTASIDVARAWERGVEAVLLFDRRAWTRRSQVRSLAAQLDRELESIRTSNPLGTDPRIVVCSAVGRAPYGRIAGERERSSEHGLALAIGPDADGLLDRASTVQGLARSALNLGA